MRSVTRLLFGFTVGTAIRAAFLMTRGPWDAFAFFAWLAFGCMVAVCLDLWPEVAPVSVSRPEGRASSEETT